ncbi:MAG: aspartate aminotransferase family protein [Saprospiraceae bacterium]
MLRFHTFTQRNPKMHIRHQFLERIAQTSDISQQFEVSSANGCYLETKSGDKFLDLLSGFGVNNIGHGVTPVIDAIHKQSNAYLHTNVYGEHIQSPQIQFAELLISLLPGPLNACYFLNSGSECVDAAIKLGRLATGRTEIIVCSQAYHGSTLGAESLRSDANHKMGFLPLIPAIRFIRFNEEADLEQITSQTALVITEVIQSEAGVKMATPDYWKKLRETCDDQHCLLAVDEIQTGMGRTGTLFAFQAYEFIPDMLLCGKALGAGMPLSALICNQKLIQHFSKKIPLGYITTFGGHPVCCAAGLAGLNYLLQHNILDSVNEKEQLFRQALNAQASNELRGIGLLLAFELGSTSKLMKAIQKLFDLKILAESFLFCPTALRIAPPLVIELNEINRVCDHIKEACNF